jgi:hypothetical protein
MSYPQIFIRVSGEMKASLQEVATNEGRTLSGLVKVLLRDGLRGRGYEIDHPPPRRARAKAAEPCAGRWHAEPAEHTREAGAGRSWHRGGGR